MKAKNVGRLYTFGLAFLLLAVNEVFADPAVLFDFNTLSPGIESGSGADSIEAYMSGLHGAQITVDTGAQISNQGIKVKRKYTHLGNSEGALGIAKLSKKQQKLRASDTFLVNPAHVKGAQTRLTLDFGNKPLTSFEFDFEIFPMKKKFPAGLVVKADGETILEYSASGKSKKTGYLGHQGLFVFESAVHELEFIGTPNTPIGIDNLLVNVPVELSGGSVGGVQLFEEFNLAFNGNPDPSGFSDPANSSGGSGSTGDGYVGTLQEVPEPSSLLLIGAGLAAVSLRRFRFAR
ncbi:MAG: PEP-CTERM sorting domain-containing protein [Candidatus Binatia bacterium]